MTETLEEICPYTNVCGLDNLEIACKYEPEIYRNCIVYLFNKGREEEQDVK